MSAKANGYEADILNLVFSNVDLSNLGDAAGLQNSVGNGNLNIELHTADPGKGGDQTTSVIGYTDYVSVSVPRDPTFATGWTDASAGTNGETDNVAAITFPICGASGATASDVSIGNGVSDEMLYFGSLDADLVITTGVTPEFAAGALNIDEA